MRFPSIETVEKVRAKYPIGTRVELVKMDEVIYEIIFKGVNKNGEKKSGN